MTWPGSSRGGCGAGGTHASAWHPISSDLASNFLTKDSRTQRRTPGPGRVAGTQSRTGGLQRGPQEDAGELAGGTAASVSPEPSEQRQACGGKHSLTPVSLRSWGPPFPGLPGPWWRLSLPTRPREGGVGLVRDCRSPGRGVPDVGAPH